jgi:hypothetical protein
MGTLLPGEYVEFVSRYGTGGIDSFLWIFSPIAENEGLNEIVQSRTILETWRSLPVGVHREMGLALFPDAGGILPFGCSDNGDLLFWRTKGEPDKWDILLISPRDGELQECGRSFFAFLDGVLSGLVRISFFPSDFPSAAPSFEPTDG